MNTKIHKFYQEPKYKRLSYEIVNISRDTLGTIFLTINDSSVSVIESNRLFYQQDAGDFENAATLICF